MSKKIEAIDSALIITDTVSGLIEVSQPAKELWYNEEELQGLRIKFESIRFLSESTEFKLYPPFDLSQAVNGSLTPFSESTFRDFCTANLGKSSPDGGAGLTNVVDINSASDFPAAVGGVRELVPNIGDAITYRIAADNIDMGSDRFTVTSGDIVIIGMHRTESTLISTTTGTFITCVDGAFFPEFIGFDCPNAKVIDFSVPTASFKSLVLDNVIIRNCDTIATISGAFSTSFRTLTVSTTATGGVTWVGTGNGQFNMSNSLGFSWSGTLFDLGTATFNVIDIGSGNRFLSPAGTTILSGATGSANLNATGRALVDNNLFNGVGAALSGIDTMDLKWNFSGNTFVDGTTLNSRQLADSYLTSTQAVTIGTAGLYVPIAGTNWSSDISDRFTVSSAGLITYIGLANIEIEAMAFSTIELSSGGADKICSKIAINGVVQDKTMSCTENNTPSGVSSVGLFTISTGDTIQTFIGNEDTTGNIDVSESSLIVKGG